MTGYRKAIGEKRKKEIQEFSGAVLRKETICSTED
jgi:hypothetical protein